jgi:hypothetical protein
MSKNIFDKYWTLNIIRILWVVFVILIVASFLFFSYLNIEYMDYIPLENIVLFIISHILGLLLIRLIFESIAVRFDTFNALQELNKKADWMLHINNDDK